MNQAIQTVLKDPAVLNSVVFCAGALAGQILHAAKKWAEGYVWVASNPKATVGALVANLAGMAGFIATGALDAIPSPVTALWMGIFMGLSADSVINRGAKKPWTDEERAKKTGG